MRTVAVFILAAIMSITAAGTLAAPVSAHGAQKQNTTQSQSQAQTQDDDEDDDKNTTTQNRQTSKTTNKNNAARVDDDEDSDDNDNKAAAVKTAPAAVQPKKLVETGTGTNVAALGVLAAIVGYVGYMLRLKRNLV